MRKIFRFGAVSFAERGADGSDLLRLVGVGMLFVLLGDSDDEFVASGESRENVEL